MKARIKSFSYAIQGIKTFFQEEIHARIHLAFAIIAIIASLFFQITTTEWILILLCIFSVFTAEIFNTAIERLSDKVEKKEDALIKKTKDLASAAVLIVSVMSVVIAGIVFIPKIVERFF